MFGILNIVKVKRNLLIFVGGCAIDTGGSAELCCELQILNNMFERLMHHLETANPRIGF